MATRSSKGRTIRLPSRTAFSIHNLPMQARRIATVSKRSGGERRIDMEHAREGREKREEGEARNTLSSSQCHARAKQRTYPHIAQLTSWTRCTLKQAPRTSQPSIF